METNKVLIVEDDPARLKVFKQNLIGKKIYDTKDPKEAMLLLVQHEFDTIYLDHDLGDDIYVPSGEDTGYAVAAFIAAAYSVSLVKVRRIVLHTCNPVGAVNMARVLDKYGINYEVIPFPVLKVTLESKHE